MTLQLSKTINFEFDEQELNELNENGKLFRYWVDFAQKKITVEKVKDFCYLQDCDEINTKEILTSFGKKYSDYIYYTHHHVSLERIKKELQHQYIKWLKGGKRNWKQKGFTSKQEFLKSYYEFYFV